MKSEICAVIAAMKAAAAVLGAVNMGSSSGRRVTPLVLVCEVARPLLLPLPLTRMRWEGQAGLQVDLRLLQ